MGALLGTGKGPGSESGGIPEDLHGYARLARRHNDEVHVEVIAETLVRADGGDDSRGIGKDRKRIDLLVPRIVGREHLEGGEDPVGLGSAEEHRLRDFRHRRPLAGVDLAPQGESRYERACENQNHARIEHN
jgi:hypothetical protein